MKNLVLLLAISSLIFVSCKEKVADDILNSDSKNQNSELQSEIPNTVLQEFAEKYPNVKDVEWEKEDNIYEAEFELNDIEYEAEFDSDGNWIMTEHEISELPESVVNAIDGKYDNYEIEEAESVETAKYGDTYEVEIEIETNDNEIVRELLINNEGTILKDEIEEDGDDDGDDDEEENEEEINISDLPQVIKDDISSRFENAKLIEAEKITMKNGKEIYEIEIVYNGNEIDVTYDENGKFLGQEED
jgi:hypothetical protein